MQILLQPLVVMRTWQSQDVCALSRHCEPCKQSSWSRAKGLTGEQAFPHSKWCGHPKSHWTIAVLCEKALNLHPSKCQVPNHSWVDWWGWWEADGKSDGKLPELGLNSGPLTQGHNHYTTQPPHTHTHTHKHVLTQTHEIAVNSYTSIS